MNRIKRAAAAALVCIIAVMGVSQPVVAGSALVDVLDAQPEDVKARYQWRHPAETLDLFGVEPGMTVVEALPGGGWYSQLLLPYLGTDGHLIGADYAWEMYPLFGFFSDEHLEAKKTWTDQFKADAAGWSGDSGASVDAFVFGSLPDAMKGTADVVLFIRALHNLARFEEQGGYLSSALKNAHDVLKPGGIVGVVQHQAPDAMPDEWANGSKGYLKRDFVVSVMDEAGFDLVDESDINNNPKDQPGADDIVWRLPPGLFTSRDNPELRAQMQEIGESNRMTLKFRKR